MIFAVCCGLLAAWYSWLGFQVFTDLRGGAEVTGCFLSAENLVSNFWEDLLTEEAPMEVALIL